MGSHGLVKQLHQIGSTMDGEQAPRPERACRQ